MLFSEAEYGALVRPLLTGDHPSPEDAVAWIGFSHLCEPSDMVPILLTQEITSAQLMQAVIDRLDSSAVAGLVGREVTDYVEDKLEISFEKLWQNATERWLPRLSKNAVVESLEWMAQAQTSESPKRLLVKGGADFPAQVSDLEHHEPFALWCSGNTQLLSAERTVSIVGTRQSSRYGADIARDLGAVAAMNEIVTISGGAFGIDAIIHESALALESPTVALMAGGLANLYPRNNLNMIQEIERKGLVIAELPPMVAPAKWRFLMRNRLIAALSQATVVVEAGRTSGALNTAATAVHLGRTCAIVPGPITSARSIGCHDFLNDHLGGVQILARPQDLPKLLEVGASEATQQKTLGVLEKRALDAFGVSSIESWEVQRLAGLTVRETQIALGSLELLGLVERVGSRYQRVS